MRVPFGSCRADWLLDCRADWLLGEGFCFCFIFCFFVPARESLYVCLFDFLIVNCSRFYLSV